MQWYRYHRFAILVTIWSYLSVMEASGFLRALGNSHPFFETKNGCDLLKILRSQLSKDLFTHIPRPSTAKKIGSLAWALGDLTCYRDIDSICRDSPEKW